MVRWIGVFLAACAAAQQVDYRIYRAPTPIVIDGRLDEAAWQFAPPVGDFVFNWHTSGEKEPTEAKLLWDDDNLYVSWRSSDRHISAYETKRHGPVSRDDCVEIFISPNPQKVRNYYTFEINAIGAMLNRCRTDWWTGPATWEPEGVQYRTTYQDVPQKDESADDREWIVEMAIPLRNFSRDAARTPPRDGDSWRLNLMRTGGKTNAQQSTWSPIQAPARSFHTPEAFGAVTFAAQAASRRTVASRSFRREDAAAGRDIYNRSCTVCHGLDGAAGDRAPALGAQRRYLRSSNTDLFDAIKNGIQGTLMPASPLADADVWKIIAYIRSLRATAIDVAVPGDPEAGRRVFEGKGKCVDCHMVGGRGGLAGPDLTNIGAERKIEQLREALTQPRPHIPRGFEPVEVTTAGGHTVRGVLKNENNFSYQILGLDQKLHLLTREEVRSMRYEEKSLMPSDYDRQLTPAEFQDLLAFLSRLARHAR